MQKPCPNHGRYGDKEKSKAMKKLVAALEMLWNGEVKPGRRVKQELRFAEVWAAALCATVLLRAGESLFVIYLKNFATLNAVYGAFGGMVALLLWIYLSGCIFIFGACLCAGQAEALRQRAPR